MNSRWMGVLNGFGEKLLEIFSTNIGKHAAPHLIISDGRLARTRDGFDLLQAIRQWSCQEERILVDTLLKMMRNSLHDNTTSFLVLLGYILKNAARWNEEIKPIIESCLNNHANDVGITYTNVDKAIDSIVKTTIFPELKPVLRELFVQWMKSPAIHTQRTGAVWNSMLYVAMMEVPRSETDQLYIHYDPESYTTRFVHDFGRDEFCVQFDESDMHIQSAPDRKVFIIKDQLSKDEKQDLMIYFGMRYDNSPIYARSLNDADGFVELYRKKMVAKETQQEREDRAMLLLRKAAMRNDDKDALICEDYRLRASKLLNKYHVIVAAGKNAHEKMMLVEDGIYTLHQMSLYNAKRSLALTLKEIGIDVLADAIGEKNWDYNHLDSALSYNACLEKLIYCGDFFINSYVLDAIWR